MEDRERQTQEGTGGSTTRHRRSVHQRRTQLGIALLCLLVAACASGGAQPTPKLPEGWGSAATASPPPVAKPATNPETEELTRERAAIALRSGDHLLATGDRARAFHEYLTAHQLDPESPGPQERIAYLHLERDPARSEALFASLLEREPERVSAQVGLGLARLARNDLPGAVAALEKARALDTDCGRASAALGLAYDGLGRHADAQSQYRHAATQRPSDVEVLNNRLSTRFAAAAARPRRTTTWATSCCRTASTRGRPVTSSRRSTWPPRASRPSHRT
jgi:tetratricopeptide (TPR) repeat protein